MVSPTMPRPGQIGSVPRLRLAGWGVLMHRWSVLPLVLLALADCSSEEQQDGTTSLTGGGVGASAAAGSSSQLGEEQSGEATYYDATGAGACSFDPSPGALNVAALNAPDWQGSAWCGACADISGPSGEARVRIVDLCPECSSGDLDLSPQAFDEIAERQLGRVPITWSLVACEVSGPVAYRFKDGVNPFWTALQVHNHRLPIAEMEWSKDGESWTQMVRQDYNYFLEEGGFGEGRTRVRITASDGQMLEDELPPVEELLVVQGSAQFQ